MSWAEVCYIEGFTRENDMIGYIFMVENLTNNKKYIGKYLSVVFDKGYFGDNDALLDDVEKLGEANFNITMLSACEELKYVDAVYKLMLDKYNAETDTNYYNCTKKPRRKKDEPLS